jgi:hypothetical protein
MRKRYSRSDSTHMTRGTFDEAELPEDDRHAIISTAVIAVAEYRDEHELYIDGYEVPV